MICECAGYSRGLATCCYGTKGGPFGVLFKSLSHLWFMSVDDFDISMINAEMKRQLRVSLAAN